MAMERGQTGPLILHGIVGGILAGLIFAMAEMVMAVLMGADFFGPLRMIGSIALGADALSPAYSLGTAILGGVGVHVILSAIYGLVFLYALALTNQVESGAGLLLLYGSVYGLALWILNFLIIAPVVWPQFTMVDQFWMGFVAHAFFFGTALGGYVVAARPGLTRLPTR